MDEAENSFIISMIEKALRGPRRLYMLLQHPDDDYYGAEGFIDSVTVSKFGSLYIEFKTWSAEEGTYVPATIVVDVEDIRDLTIKKYNERLTLMFET